MIASVAMIAVALVALVAGGVLFWLLAVVAALFMMAEWANLSGASPREKRIGQFALSVPLALMAPASLILEVHDFFTLGLLVGAAFFVVIVTNRRQLALGILYCGLPVLALVVLRRHEAGLVHALWALALVWATDIGAFFAGRSLGGPKLAPRISPAKTWSGLIGGILLATAFAFAMHVGEGLPFRLVLATPLLAILAQGGDLLESWIKRRAGVKDSGNVLPGHGGVLDRLDGVVPVAPIAALIVLLT
ncbi:phosphatidate cytidylyltransferase [Sphingomonas sp. KR1UV-12]|uniref:Phosphatidate cytidylyltransferase n=1 Tax=Sphingomonas aurea TaxID=3063994 RepID=A0ABT9EGU8_9SPHN|nr:phosphatidate cytidylyltransferase [Sphingomonas sp. KR1UV-12]MDP1026192.1 phosphatidate cytidylyltransferase [Sphingomonas sp. KR1UV-12]